MLRDNLLLYNILIILAIIFLNGCSNSPKKTNISNINHINKNFERYYNVWDIDNALKELDKMQYEDNIYLNYDLIKEKLKKRENKKKELSNIVVDIKGAIESNSIEIIKTYLESTVSNKLKLNELKKYNLSGVKLYYDDINYFKEEAEMTAAFVYLDDIQYFLVKFKLSNDKWFIKDFLEKGEF